MESSAWYWEKNCEKAVQGSKQNLVGYETTELSQELGGELTLLMPYVPLGIKEIKKKKKRWFIFRNTADQ